MHHVRDRGDDIPFSAMSHTIFPGTMRIDNGGGFRLETSVGYREFNATARRYKFQVT